MSRPIFISLLSLGLAACGTEASIPDADNSPEVYSSDKSRITSPAVTSEGIDSLVSDNTDFGWDMYRSSVAAAENANLVFSPYSLSSAFGMLYAGAAGETKTQLADGFGFGGRDEADFHAGMNAIDLALPESDGDTTIRVANDLWVQTGFHVEAPFLDTLAEHYGAGMQGVNFKEETEVATDLINGYISDVTEGKIPTLFGPGSLNTLTRLVLTNAVYFKASWQYPFEEQATQTKDFHLLDGSTVEAELMHSTKSYYYGEEAGRYQAVELPYENNDLAFLIVMPESGTLGDFEQSMDSSELAAIAGSLSHQEVAVALPKFELNTTLDTLSEDLKEFGMTDMFIPGIADFSGITAIDLFVQTVVHKAYIQVNEAGTEAAAATAIVGGITSVPPPPVPMTIDRPFLYFIRHIPTGNCLFMGRVVDPLQE